MPPPAGHRVTISSISACVAPIQSSTKFGQENHEGFIQESSLLGPVQARWQLDREREHLTKPVEVVGVRVE